MALSTINNFVKLMILIAIWLCPGLALSNPSVLLVYNNSHFGIVHRIEAALFTAASPKAKINHLIIDKLPTTKPQNALYPPSDLIVTIGQDALSAVLHTQSTTPVLSILTRQTAFETLLAENKNLLDNTKRHVTAIFPDQPLSRQFALIKSLSPDFSQKPVGILLGLNALQDQESLQELAAHYDLKLSVLNVNKDENPVAELDSLLNDVKVVLALPDHQLYNSQNARGMLLTAFHKRVPLIGYSRTFVNNGALAAIYATTKQIAGQTAEQILQILQNKNKPLPAPQFPSEFSISINYQVASILKLNLSPEKDIIASINQLEKIQPPVIPLNNTKVSG